MDTARHYTSRIKMEIKDSIDLFLYKEVNKSQSKRLHTIAERNCVMQGCSHLSFSYKNMAFNADVTAPPRRSNRLAPALKEEVEEFLEDQKRIFSLEKPKVFGFIDKVLNSTNELHDYLKVLPEVIHPAFENQVKTCSCQTKKLSQEQIDGLIHEGQPAIKLIKERMALNLLY